VESTRANLNGQVYTPEGDCRIPTRFNLFNHNNGCRSRRPATTTRENQGHQGDAQDLRGRENMARRRSPASRVPVLLRRALRGHPPSNARRSRSPRTRVRRRLFGEPRRACGSWTNRAKNYFPDADRRIRPGRRPRRPAIRKDLSDPTGHSISNVRGGGSTAEGRRPLKRDPDRGNCCPNAFFIA